MCNRQRQAVTDGINSESEYSGGQWFLNHLCSWNRSASSPRGNNTLVTRVGAASFQRGTVSVKKDAFTLLLLREMAGYLGDGWQLHRDDKVFVKWGSTYNHPPIESHLSSYIRCEGGQSQLLIKVRRDKLDLKEATEKYQYCTSDAAMNIKLLQIHSYYWTAINIQAPSNSVQGNI